MYKIYLNDLPITLVQPDYPNFQYDDKEVLQFKYEENADLLAIINYAEQYPNAKEVIVWGEDIEALRSDFFGNFIYIEAGGGVVFNPAGDMLLIKRHDIWELPKGKLDQEEAPDVGALREVSEETGVENLQMAQPIRMDGLNQRCTYHNYSRNLKRILKATHWYIMQSDFEGQLKPQEDEGIQEAKWVPRTEVMKYLSRSYKTIRDVAAAALRATEAEPAR